MVNQISGYEKRLSVRVHLDSMRRVTIREQSYAYYPIENTTFSLGVAWPADYGDLKFRGQVEIKLQQSGLNGADEHLTSCICIVDGPEI